MKHLVIVTTVIGAYALPIGLRSLGQDHYITYFLLVEDGIYESLGAIACLVAGLLFAFTFFCGTSQSTESERGRSPWWLLFAIGLLLMFLEETSWGQRILGFDTPGLIGANNIVGEANLHNLRAFYLGDFETNLLQAVWMLMVVIYLGILPMVAQFCEFFATAMSRWRFPLPSSAECAGLWLNVLGFVVTLYLLRYEPSLVAGQQATEIFETLTQLMLFVVSYQTFVSHVIKSHRRWALVSALAIGASVAVPLLAVILRMNLPFAMSIGAIRQGDALVAMGDVPGAIAKYERAITIWPKSALAFYAKGNALTSQGKLPEAAAAHSAALQLVPTFTQAQLGLASVQLRLENWENAESLLKSALSRDPTNPDAWNLYGVLLMHNGDRSNGMECFRKALALNPDHLAANENLQQASAQLE